MWMQWAALEGHALGLLIIRLLIEKSKEPLMATAAVGSVRKFVFEKAQLSTCTPLPCGIDRKYEISANYSLCVYMRSGNIRATQYGGKKHNANSSCIELMKKVRIDNTSNPKVLQLSSPNANMVLSSS